MSSKDFGSIFKTNTADKMKKDSEYQDKGNSVIRVDPKNCVNWKYSDRSEFELGDIEDLAQDIKRNGQVQPILVRKTENNKYEVIAGERRWRACLSLNINLMAIEVNQDDVSAFMSQHSENNQRPISPYSRSISYSKLLHDNLISQNALAAKLNIKKSTFSELLAFSYVPDELWEAVGDMTNVSISTASYIRKVLNENPDKLDFFFSISNKIKHGAGKGTIKKLLENNNESEIKIIKDSDGNTLMKVRGNKIEFTNVALSIIPMDSILNLLNVHISSVE